MKNIVGVSMAGISAITGIAHIRHGGIWQKTRLSASPPLRACASPLIKNARRAATGSRRHICALFDGDL